MRHFLTLLVALLPLFAKAQLGHYFLSHYSPGKENTDAIAYDIAQGANGYLYFATRSGVLAFDGRNWELISNNSAVYSIEVLRDNQVYWAGASGFGKLVRRPDGTLESQTLSHKEQSDIYQVLGVDNTLYLLSDEHIYMLGERDTVTALSRSSATGDFLYLFELSGKPHISTDEGIFQIDGGRLTRSTIPDSEQLLFTFSHALEGEYIVGSADNDLFLYKGNRLTRIQLQETNYLKASVVVDGWWINPNLVALATLRGGVIFLNPRSGRIEEIVNYHTGLPDNEVLAILGDKDRNLWVAHEYGFTRIEPFHPFRTFSHYDGLRGNVLCAQTFNSDVYVGTSLGLFRLVEETQYDEIVYYEDSVEVIPGLKVVPAAEEKNDVPSEISTQSTEQEPEKKRKGFLRFLKRSRDKIEEPKPAPQEAIPAPDQETTVVELQTQEQYIIHKIKKTERLVRSAQHVYRQVLGIDSKISHLTVSNNELIAAGLSGVYVITDQQAKNILEEPIRSVFNTSDNVLVVSTYADQVKALTRQGPGWSELPFLTSFEDQVSFMFEDLKHRLWLCALDKVYRINRNPEGQAEIRPIEVPNPNFSKMMGIAMPGRVVLVNESGFYEIEEESADAVRTDSTLLARNYFVTANRLLFDDEHGWNVFGESEDHLELLSTIREIRFIAANGDQNNLWVVTEDNELYKFYGDRVNVLSTRFPLVLKSVKVGDRLATLQNGVKIDQEDGAIRIEVIQPAYTRADAIQYRYRLQGISPEWSEWSAGHNVIDFPFLPVGNYTLAVQARDIFGNVSDMDAFRFQVQPPFWKRPWFYAMEFSVFSLLVLLSFKLSVRYRFVSRVLSLLTIILLIEFIQTIAGSAFTTHSSPIIDFIIQVIVAFLILPVEGYLRDLMFRSMGSGSRLYDVIAELNKTQKKR
jgi:hypothetical protein